MSPAIRERVVILWERSGIHKACTHPLRVYYSLYLPSLVRLLDNGPLDDFSISVLLPFDGGGCGSEVESFHLEAQVLPFPLDIIGESRAGRCRAYTIPRSTEHGPCACCKWLLGSH